MSSVRSHVLYLSSNDVDKTLHRDTDGGDYIIDLHTPLTLEGEWTCQVIWGKHKSGKRNSNFNYYVCTDICSKKSLGGDEDLPSIAVLGTGEPNKIVREWPPVPIAVKTLSRIHVFLRNVYKPTEGIPQGETRSVTSIVLLLKRV